jgi:hypothetical protein
MLRLGKVHDADGKFRSEVLSNIGFGAESQRKPGSVMIGIATGLLFLLGAGLLAVSLAAQYSYLFRQRHQSAASLIEALALDVGMVIFSLLALGLARSGKPAKAERVLIMVCAGGSALMNYAAADVFSPRSVLAYVMPPVFLAVVADRVISVVRRHFLGEKETRSAWAAMGAVVLYGLRFVLAPPSTARGVRRYVLQATPLPEITAAEPVPVITSVPRRPRAIVSPRTGTKTGDLLDLVVKRYGPLEALPLADCSKIATTLAGEIDLHPGSARTALLKAARSAQNGHSEEASA